MRERGGEEPRLLERLIAGSDSQIVRSLGERVDELREKAEVDLFDALFDIGLPAGIAGWLVGWAASSLGEHADVIGGLGVGGVVAVAGGLLKIRDSNIAREEANILNRSLVNHLLDQAQSPH